ncbi:acyltransferase family protein [Stenotrophomonas sp. MMGLT7]|uniref:acyltransferase family protein n=1 Tax=Stenotrophomonas sp. MMGLT7 TaxID=2901227 RepID=UPI001E3B8A0C|nr:acyltransferase family protein [Stenotrophomonas sp. MMGLT7]MCD7097312.1 hypothetical protein [Stenotrophomonas sp. MMGLT7]
MGVRDGRIDAAKFVLVVMVVIGHVVERGQVDPGQLVYRWIYLFHMPAFIFLSGLVSSELVDGRRGGRLAALVVLPYLFHQGMAQGLDAWLSGRAFGYAPGTPYWALWYLMSLCLWRLALPVAMGTGAPLLLACVAGLGAGFVADFGYAWSSSRTLVFFPFFVLGHLYARQGGVRLPGQSLLLGGAGLAGVAVIALLCRDVPLAWLYGAEPYATFAASAPAGMLLRALQLIAGVIGAFSLFALVPAAAPLVKLGRHTMAIFIIHIYLLMLMQAGGWLDRLQQLADLPAALAVVALATAVSLVAVAFGRLVPWVFDFSWLLDALGRLAQGRAGRRAQSPHSGSR